MKYTDADLVQYADGTLSDERTRILLQASLHDQELAQSLAALDASCLPFKAAHTQYSLLEAPAALREDIADMVSAGTYSDDKIGHMSVSAQGRSGKSATGAKWFHWARGVSVAACVGLCFSLGYWLGSAGSLPYPAVFNNEQSADNALTTQMAWVERVADYQSLYVANTVKDIIPNQNEATQLLDSIEQRSGMRAGIPDLSEKGYEFVRAQELGYMDRPLVQIVYHKAGAHPLALCYTPSSQLSDTELILSSYHGLNTASWVARGQQFVLVGSEDSGELRQLYTSVAQVL